MGFIAAKRLTTLRSDKQAVVASELAFCYTRRPY